MAGSIFMNYEEYEGWQATIDAMSDPDWPKRLARAKRESREGKWITLEELTKRRMKHGIHTKTV